LSELGGRGRTGMLFLAVLFVVVFLALLGSALSADVVHGWVLPTLGLCGAVLLALLGRALWLACTRKHERGAVGELSDDELSKARVKLASRSNPKSP
jgi:uncharacterized membrane protein